MVVELLNINGTVMPHTIIPIIGDGACLFRAISFVLYDTQDKAQEVRKNIVTYVINHSEDYSIMSHDSDGNNYGSSADYFTDMLKFNTYGGLCELVAAEQLFLVFIEVTAPYIHKQAYDSIDRDKLWKALEVLGIPKKYVSLIKGCNNRTVCRVRLLQEMSETFEVKSGLRQEDALSPTLFNLALEKAMREAWDGRKMEVCGERVILAYADDIVIMGETRDEVINTASKLLKASKIIGLRVNEEKTKYLMVARRSPNIDHITVDDYIFKKVEVFKYLGVNLNSNNDMHEEINDRIACGNRCYYSIRRLLKSKLLSHNSKTLLYHSYLRPIITYVSETWSLTKGDSKRLMTFERKVLRKIYGPKLNAESQTYERRKNQELQELYNRPNIISYIKSKRLEWSLLSVPPQQWVMSKPTEVEAETLQPLYSLIMGFHPDHKNFMGCIRKYNNCFQMTSFGAKQIIEDGFMPTFIVKGQVYHLIGSLQALPQQNPQFLQIYFVGDDER
ncbi:OTU domain,Reverse transcriptase domain [Cinara cedri]|uniref:OTU domain,Reverse transcriptase domain n=1 Tax=Cinara cedri TaxID=506608 RepID=A0A5E4MI62_9HEMI|nr:OTU domain,Reverse transcriptase domain [Cinara cedri]